MPVYPLADIWNYKLTPGVVELLKRMEKRVYKYRRITASGLSIEYTFK